MKKTCSLCGGHINKANKNGICQKCLSIKIDPLEAMEETMQKGYILTAVPKNISDNGLRKFLKRTLNFDLTTARFEETVEYLKTKIINGVIPNQKNDTFFKNILTGLRNRKLTIVQQNILNSISPNILGRISRQEDRERCINEVTLFVKKNKRLPKRSILEERKLANWLRDKNNSFYKQQLLKLL